MRCTSSATRFNARPLPRNNRGEEVEGRSNVSLSGLLEWVSGNPDLSRPDDGALFKSRLKGLSLDDLLSLSLTSDENVSNSYIDSLIWTAEGLISANFGVLYSSASVGETLSFGEYDLLLKKLQINAVHNPSTEATLETKGGDSFTRLVFVISNPYESESVRTLLTEDPGYGDKVAFLLQRMDAAGHKFIVEDLYLRHFDGTHNAVYVDRGATDDETLKSWALDGLREWCKWNINMTDEPPSGKFLDILTEWASPPHITDGAVSVGSTYDFLYLFSAAASSVENPQQMIG